MAKCDYTEFANLCSTVISDPTRLSSLKPFLSSHDPVVLLSLYKVFKNIIPLYKLKIKEDKIQHKQSYIKLQTHEKTLYMLYKVYVNRISKSKTAVSFQIASLIMLELDHFNFAEKMINKVLIGTRNKDVKALCVDSIIQKVKSDTLGDSTFKIMLTLMEFDLCDEVYECIIQSNVVDSLTPALLEVVKVEKDPKVKLLMKNKHGKGIEKSSLKSRQNKKDDVELNRINKNLLIEKEKKKADERIIVKRKLVDNLMRIYFMILNGKRESLYRFSFIGLGRYKRFIKTTHKDGLIIMLNEVLKESGNVNRVYACTCIIQIFGEEKFEFRNLIETVFELLAPLRYSFSADEKKIIVDVVHFLFLKNKQALRIVHIFLQRFLQFATLCFFPELEEVVEKMIKIYKCDIYDYDIVKNGVYDPECDSVEFVGNHPLYLGPLFEKLRSKINKD